MNAAPDSHDLAALAEENARLRAALARAEEELQHRRVREADQSWREQAVAETAGMWTWEADLRGGFLWEINRPPGLGLDEVPIAELGSRYFGMIVPEDLQRMVSHHGATIERRERFITHRYRLMYPDGSLHYMEGRGALLYDAAGQACRVVGVTRDVTREVEAAEALHDAQRRLERASISSQEGHWDLDLQTRKWWVSGSFHALLGYSRPDGELEAQACIELVHPEDRAGVHAAFTAHVEQDALLDIEIRMRPADGQWRWMRVRGMAEFDEARRAKRVSGSIQDIHQQKLAEDDLRAARQRFARAIRATQDGLWEWDLADDAFWVSPRYEAILGYQEGEMPRNQRALTHPEDLPRVLDAFRAHFKDGTPYDVEVRLQHASGHYLWIHSRGQAERDAHGRAVRLAGSIQDVTEARAARDALIRATEAAQAANLAKGEFLANVSHEIRTPMNGIIGMTALLLDTKLDRTQVEYAETIRSSADSLLTVINDILDFSKIEAGKLDIESLDMDLRTHVEDVGSVMAFQAAAKNLELIVNVSPEVPERVSGDPQRIRQCLINLVGNAIKFTRSGEIVIEVCTVGRREGKALTHFEVRDTGIGIAPDTARNLFQPFMQADSSTTRHFGGTGLGLSIVRRLVDLMGGQVGMESEPGKGSTFWFTLPLATDEPTCATRKLENLAGGRRVLVVDDNETNRGVLAGLLTRAGYEVSLASSGAEALELLSRAAGDNAAFDAVLADFQMPEMDGALLGERINADPALAGTHRVLLTSLDRSGDSELFASLGFAAYLTKPVRTRELLDCMKKVLASHTDEWHLRTQPIITRSRLREEAAVARYSGRILVVEDNHVNQIVAQRFLERLGCSVAIAANGADGVRACEHERFDLVLMDLQMPVMDGMAATRQIRVTQTGGARVPIVALTANAMPGQLERCLAADMDGLLTKPLAVERLIEILERFDLMQKMPSPYPARDSTAPAASGGPALLDTAKFHEMTEGDADFASEIAAVFISSGAESLAEIRRHIAAGDCRELARAAHKLKGACANIHAVHLRELCSDLEVRASAMSAPDRQAHLERIATALELTAIELQRACGKEDSAAPGRKSG